jgi:Domain of unknown function (DUF5664)
MRMITCMVCEAQVPETSWLGHKCKSGAPIFGIKADSTKLPLDLLDPVALEGLAAVLAFGANKYAAHNWRGGFKWMRLMAALLRHAFAIIRGEDTDPESGLPHIDHLGCCWMFLSNMMKTRKDLDDRWKSPVIETAAAVSAESKRVF